MPDSDTTKTRSLRQRIQDVAAAANRSGLRVAALYLVLGVIWIIFTDRVLVFLVGTMAEQAMWQLIKGLVFVAGTAAIMLGLVIQNKRRNQRSQDLLAEREEYFRALFERAPSAYQSLDPEGVILDVNEAWLALLEVESREEVVGQHMSSFLEASQLVLMQERFPHFKRTGRLQDAEFILCRRGGSMVTVTVDGRIERDVDGSMIRTHCVLHDITDRKQAEVALQKSEERLRRALAEREQLQSERDRLFEMGIDLICVADMDGRLVQVNPAWTRVLGWSEDELLDRPWPELLHPDDQKATTRALLDLGAGQPVEGHVSRFQHREGSWRWISWNVHADLEARQLLASGRDVTDRLSLEEQLRQAQKMEAVGQLAGGVAHDFNNLLQVINGYTELVMTGLTEGDDNRRCLDEVQRAGRKASDLVTQLLTFSRRQVITPEVMDLNLMVAENTALMAGTLGERIELIWEPAADLARINADRNQIEQVMMNLCINARDAMPDGGRLTLSTENVAFAAEDCRCRSWAQEGRFVKLAISDTGVGLSPDMMTHIWEPFYTTKDPGKGTGLGLSTVYGIVSQHGGMVNVTSRLEAGAIFEVYLPRVDAEPNVLPRPAKATMAGGHETVLVVDDNPQVRDLVCVMLRRVGYTVLSAVDGETALELLDERGQEVDLALLDVVMHGMGGPEVYARTTERFPHLKYLFASGYSREGMDSDRVLDGGLALIQKPFEAPELMARVRAVLDGVDAGE